LSSVVRGLTNVQQRVRLAVLAEELCCRALAPWDRPAERARAIGLWELESCPGPMLEAAPDDLRHPRRAARRTPARRPTFARSSLNG